MASTSTRSPNPNQLATSLPGLTTHITGHDPATGKAIVKESRPGNWSVYDNKLMAFNVVYTTSEFPANLNDDKDLKLHDQVMESGKLGLVNPHGTSLDYGIVLEGDIDLVLDSGETKPMRRGDVAVQRATMHAWKNTSETEWARMIFVLQDCQKLEIGGTVLKEDLGRGVEGLPASGNDS
ncbi:hypothetical protein HRR78_007244 [Exophiala dermatitidis]|nr:hypothetical protein HRR75_005256 [Exophiala dermatitidis]KAJ4541655.1 hypothetical protein HRR78_007244 [Exophiala dermatitidis]